MPLATTAQKGVQMKIKVGDGGDPTESFAAVAGIRNKNLTQTNDRIDITTDDDVSPDGQSYRTYLSGITEIQVSGDGVVKSGAGYNALRTIFASGLPSNYQIELVDIGTYEGAFYLTDLSVPASFDGAIEFSFTLDAASAPTYTAAT